MVNTCKDCRFWELRVAAAGTGECRRFPPQHAFEPHGGHSRVSPCTGAYFWCGEFQQREGGAIPTGQDRFVENGFPVKGFT